MKKVSVTLLSIFISTAVMAEWVSFGNTPAMDAYYEPNSIRKFGSLIKVWTLYSRSQPSYGVLSTKQLMHVNCEEEKTKLTAVSQYSLQMGNGDVVAKENVEKDWIPASPQSLGDHLVTTINQPSGLNFKFRGGPCVYLKKNGTPVLVQMR